MKLKPFTSIYLALAVMIGALVAGPTVGYAKDKKDKGDNGNGDQPQQPAKNQGGNPGAPGMPGGQRGVGPGQNQSSGQPNNPLGNGQGRRNGGGLDNGSQGNANRNNKPDNKLPDSQPPDQKANKADKVGKTPPAPKVDREVSPKPVLSKHQTASGFEETTPSGRVRTRDEKKDDGEHVTKFSPTGAKQSEEVQRKDGSKQVNRFDAAGRVRQEEVTRPDGSREVSNHQIGRDGNVKMKETVKYDVHQKIVSKTVTKTVNKTVIVNNYDHGRCGFVYHPVFVMAPLIGWYDPYWYTPAGVVIVHPFTFSWGWESYGWYHSYYGPYWTAYDVYPAPSYWVTDWMVAGYVQDHYDAQMSAAQAREDARIAREEADKAQQAAQAAQDQAEIAEAKAAQAQAELRARNAEERAARAEHMQELAGKPNPNATPIDKDTKEAFKNQIDQTIAEKKVLTEQAQKGGDPVLPDVTKALADSKHIYPVSKVISVTSAKDSNPAGNLSEGDLLKVEPGQENKLKDLGENDLVTMRVMTSKGEDGEVQAGTLVNVSVHDLQDFDSEFRAKVDAGVEQAGKNKDAFKQAAVTSAK